MTFDCEWNADTDTWCIGVGTEGRGLYGRGSTLDEAWADLIEFLGFDPRTRTF
jgi:hypothetical protein